MELSTDACRLTVITGPSGVGKGSLVRELLKSHPQIWLSISATTREPRVGEIEGKDYFFLQKDRFLQLVSDGGFLEWADFAGNSYGTPRKPVLDHLSQGQPVLLEIELEGARQIRKNSPDSFHIFLAPPSFEELENRIRGRETDSDEAIQKRLFRAREELNAKDEFDAVIINDDLQDACYQVEELMGFTTKKEGL